MKIRNKFLLASFRKDGFSLLEVMVAIGILVMVLSSLLGLVIFTARGQKISTREIAATNLARECIEVVRNIRDTNWLEFSDRGNFLNDILTSNDHDGIIEHGDPGWYDFIINAAPNDNEFPNSSHFELYKTTDGNYIQKQNGAQSGVATGFFRIVYLNDICQDSGECSVDTAGICEGTEGRCTQSIGVQVICEVDWLDRSSWKKVILTDRLYDWKY